VLNFWVDDVTVCATLSSLVTVTVLPGATVIVAGLKAKFFIVMVSAFAGPVEPDDVVGVDEEELGVLEPQAVKRSPAAARMTINTAVLAGRRPTRRAAGVLRCVATSSRRSVFPRVMAIAMRPCWSG